MLYINIYKYNDNSGICQTSECSPWDNPSGINESKVSN